MEAGNLGKKPGKKSLSSPGGGGRSKDTAGPSRGS